MNRTPTPEIDDIWDPQHQIGREWALWLEIMRTQHRLNSAAPITPGDLDRYQHVLDRYGPLELEGTVATEKRLRHETAAHLAVFNDLADSQAAHLGLTSCDITENIDQQRVLDSLKVIMKHLGGVLTVLNQRMCRYARLKIVARTHGRPAQVTTLGHRYATVVSPLLILIRTGLNYPARGVAGAVGTGADQLEVLGHDPEFDGAAVSEWWRVEALSGAVSRHVGAGKDVQEATRQVSHRSYDLQVAGFLAGLASLAQTWATDRRLEAILGLGSEERTADQIGSSAMPHKNNPRICERICALSVVQRGYLSMCAEMAGMPWLEGDVSTSAARRVVLPGMFRTADQILANWHYAATRWRPDTDAIDRELWDNTFELATGTILARYVQWGIPREKAYRLIQHAAGTKDPLEALLRGADGIERPGVDRPLSLQELSAILTDTIHPEKPVGIVDRQIAMLSDMAVVVVGRLGGAHWEPEVL